MPLPVGTIVRAHPSELRYIKDVYGQTTDLMIKAVHVLPLHVVYELSRLDGSDPTQPKFRNACYETDVINDTFRSAVRQAIKEHDQCPH